LIWKTKPQTRGDERSVDWRETIPETSWRSLKKNKSLL
jgi:hypothetical protein